MRQADTAGQVVAVVVTYERPALLLKALDAIAAQTRKPAAVIVVDNASRDGSADLARSHASSPRVIELDRNTGGAGGFTVGLATAIEIERASLVWLMDDDTIPQPNALEQLLQARDRYDGPVAALASRVIWTDGRDHPMNTPRPRVGAGRSSQAKARAVGATQVRSMSFVSMLVDVRAVRSAGLPIADYFLWNDDFEFSTRLLRRSVGLYVPASVVEHATRTFGDTSRDPGARFFNEVRNKVWLFTRSSALLPAERVLYAAATLWRWILTVARSHDRPTLVRAGARGLMEGIRRGPRPNVEVLAGFGPSTDAVSAIQADV